MQKRLSSVVKHRVQSLLHRRNASYATSIEMRCLCHFSSQIVRQSLHSITFPHVCLKLHHQLFVLVDLLLTFLSGRLTFSLPRVNLLLQSLHRFTSRNVGLERLLRQLQTRLKDVKLFFEFSLVCNSCCTLYYTLYG